MITIPITTMPITVGMDIPIDYRPGGHSAANICLRACSVTIRLPNLD